MQRTFHVDQLCIHGDIRTLRTIEPPVFHAFLFGFPRLNRLCIENCEVDRRLVSAQLLLLAHQHGIFELKMSHDVVRNGRIDVGDEDILDFAFADRQCQKHRSLELMSASISDEIFRKIVEVCFNMSVLWDSLMLRPATPPCSLLATFT